ncbi:pyridoxal phosphate-dependent enzyme [Dinoroseobacter shibae DFL 12 = DSM 16493]|uniref:L-cysteate sulfo-lyase n=1 Tax=Dinoroseobacter shibae (strain DSM 16493 / NCIMB 14021 / DFL 12) TaxID=398580 RepID=A8LJF9_DINSH|nr:pyridoxal phosphate-dependent enzyme [Dinoroseobacter shibae DFL 12 = DSM 16493]
MSSTETLDRQHAQIDLDRFPRTPLCHQPTPIEAMPRLSAALGGPSLFVKRDDCTGLAMGGNKTRKLEFLVGEAMEEKADMLVTQGAVQSNHVRQTAAAACKLGMKCHVLLERRVPGRDASYESTGNVLLDNLFGATHEFRPAGLDMNAEARTVTERLQAEGHRPYFIPGGGSNPTGALGYVACAREIAEHSRATGQSFDWLVMSTGSTGTHAGLVAGFHAMGHELPVMGVSVRQPRERQMQAVHALTQATLEKLGHDGVPLKKIIVDDGYVGEGYGIPAPSTLEAIRLTARQEGLLLDPVYSAKGMAGLIGMVRSGFFKPSDSVLFLHTGGASALFAYEDQITALAD